MLAQYLLQQGGNLFDKRTPLLSLWQEIAENFYPERADFTRERSLGSEFADGLSSGYPLLVRRDLGNSIGSILRPTNKVWAHTRTDKWDQVSHEAKAWLEAAEERMRLAMYARGTGFSRAVKEADHDFAAFGQAVLQVSVNRDANNLLYRCWHLRDCAWSENEEGRVDTMYRKWKATARMLASLFPKTIHKNVRDKLEKDPYHTFEVWHCFLPSDLAPEGDNPRGRPWRSIYLDVANEHIMEDVFLMRMEYVVPRWQTVSGSQYAYSPAVVVALPDARTLQEMTLTLLEAGEKAVTPPLLGVQEALRSDVNVMAGGITWVDREYDERLGEVLRPLTIDKSGIPLGLEMQQDVREQLREAFYLNKLALPPAGGPDMTAFEVGQRVQEYIRQALPLFEPMEYEYNAPLCENSFEVLLEYRQFDNPKQPMPEELIGRNIEFFFESPLHDAIERAKAQRFLEGSSLIANAAGADPQAALVMDTTRALRDALLGSGVPAVWLRSEGQVKDIQRINQQRQQIAELLANMQQGANIAKTIGLTPTPSGTQGTGGTGATTI